MRHKNLLVGAWVLGFIGVWSDSGQAGESTKAGTACGVEARVVSIHVVEGMDRLSRLCNSVGLQVEHCRDEAAVAQRCLSQAESEWEAAQQKVDKTMDIMVALRDLLRVNQACYRVGCHEYTRSDLTRALEAKLADYGELTRIVERRRETVDAWNETYSRLMERANNWEAKRLNLIEKVTELKQLQEQRKTDAARRDVSLNNETIDRAASLIAELQDDLRQVVPASHQEVVVDSVVSEFDLLVKERQAATKGLEPNTDQQTGIDID